MVSSVVSKGVSGQLRRRLAKALSSCGIFESNTRLEAIFVDQRLYPWRNDVPEAKSVKDRVAQVIAFLCDQYNDRQQNALLLLIEVLSEMVDSHDNLYSELKALSAELESALSPSLAPLSPMPSPPFPFVNRDEEIRQLLSPYAPRYAVVDAPAGYGKTALWDFVWLALHMGWYNRRKATEVTLN